MKNLEKYKIKTFSKSMISLIHRKLFGTSLNTALEARYGKKSIKSRDVLNSCKDNKMNEKDCL